MVGGAQARSDVIASVPALTPPVIDPFFPETSTVVASGWDANSSGTQQVTPQSSTMISPTSEVASSSNASTTATSPSNVVTPAAKAVIAALPPELQMLVGSSSTVVTPVTGVAGSVGAATMSAPALLLSLLHPAVPVSDVVTAVEQLLTSVADSLSPLAFPLPSDLVALLGFRAGDLPTMTRAQAGSQMRPSTAALMRARGHLHRPPDVAAARTPVVASPTGGVAGFDMLDEIAAMGVTGRVTPSAIGAPVAPTATESPRSLLERTVTEILVPVSLWALVTAALPGLGGLLVVTMAGVRIGYRQAKAGFALRAAGIAHLAAPGPIGVVRAGSLVALSPRALRSINPEITGRPVLVPQQAA